MTLRPSAADSVYRQLQRHLDRQPIGFPPSVKGADIRLLKHVFTPEEARIAVHLSHELRSLEEILDRAGHLVASLDELEDHLNAMVKKGGLEYKQENGQDFYANAPLVVGIYELQAGRLTREFIDDFSAYTTEKRYGISFLSTKRPQMRTIPINKSITPNQSVADYDDIVTLIQAAEPPFVILPCICRKKKAMLGKPCEQTDREETCMAMGTVAQTLVKMELGREISRKEALEIIEMNEEEGLVLQPANARKIEFLCSCCGCCCSMLSLHRDLPKPLDFWESGYTAVLNGERCVGCGLCHDACGADALTLAREIAKDRKHPAPVINPLRCIGCGQCVARCKTGALTLERRDAQPIPPEDREALNAQLLAHKQQPLAQLRTAGTLAKGMIQTGDFRLVMPKS